MKFDPVLTVASEFTLLPPPKHPDLTDHLQQLDYPHRFTVSTLASAHGSAAQFRHVAACLQWLAGRLEPGAQLAGSVHTEPERVVLVRAAAEFFVTRCGLRLNPRRLYASSAATAGELLKVTQLLIGAPQRASSGGDGGKAGGGGDVDKRNDDDDDEDALHAERSGSGTFAGATVDLGDKIDELRRARELSGELTQIGARLYELLARELHNKDRRTVQVCDLVSTVYCIYSLDSRCFLHEVHLCVSTKFAQFSQFMMPF